MVKRRFSRKRRANKRSSSMKMRGGLLVENDRQRLLNKGFNDVEADRLINEFAGLYTIAQLENLSADEITNMKQQLNGVMPNINEATPMSDTDDTDIEYPSSDEEPDSDFDGGKGKRKRRRKTNKRKSKKRKSKKTRKNKKRRQRGGIIL